MIEKLNKAQEKKMAIYRDKWVDIGLCTKRAKRKNAEKWLNKTYAVAGLAEPKIILWAESHMSLLLTAKLVKELSKKGYEPYSENGTDNVGDSVWASVRASVWDSVRDSVRDSGLRDEYWEIGSWGQHDANWLGFYDYFREVLKLEKQTEKLIPLTELAKETGWHLLYKNVAILSEKPTEIHRNAQGRLHNPNGPAIKWADGYELYRLNGIRVEKEIAMLDPKTIKKDDILKQTNADIRREIVRKLTPEQLVSVLDAKVLDEKHGYQLLGIDLGDNRTRPFLKMINPSIGVIHVEGVKPEIKTVEEAICYRNGLKEFSMPEQLT